MMKSTFGNQTSSSGWACGFARKVSPMITKRKYVVATTKPMAKPAVIIVGADKGGVGKTTVSRTLLDYFIAHQITAH